MTYEPWHDETGRCLGVKTDAGQWIPNNPQLAAWSVFMQSEQFATLSLADRAPDRRPRPLASIRQFLTPGTVAVLLPDALAWARDGDDLVLHDLANRSGDAPAAVLLVAAWLRARPDAAQAHGINLRGDV